MSLEAAITGLTATYQVLKGAIAARDEALVKNAQHELQEKLWGMSTTALTHIQALNALELEAQKLRFQLQEAHGRQHSLEAELKQRVAYALAQPAPGKWAYMSVGTLPDQPHNTTYFCAACYAVHLEVPLQYSPAGPGCDAMLRCANSPKHMLALGGALPSPPQRTVHSEGFGRDW